jgi:cytochrome c-type biogenesis protein CcmH/NrfG
MADPQDRVLRLLPVLADPVRSVRMAAAKALLDAPIARLPDPAQADLDTAMTEWRAALASRLDFPETHLQLAGMALTLRAVPQAEAAFREVVRLDPQRAEAWVMLVRIAAATRGRAAARSVLDDALAAAPHDPALSVIARDLGRD